jgi:hypothetical protein
MQYDNRTTNCNFIFPLASAIVWSESSIITETILFGSISKYTFTLPSISANQPTVGLIKPTQQKKLKTFVRRSIVS